MDTAAGGYELLALSFDGTVPCFTPAARRQTIDSQKLTIYYDHQCPYVLQSVARVQQYCAEQAVPVTLIHVDTLQKAKALPGVFNNWGVFYKGVFETVNLLDTAALERLLKK